MARKKTTVDNFAEVIEGIIEDYADNLTDAAQEATHKVALAGARALKSESKEKFGGTGKYAKGWRVFTKKTRFGQSEILANVSQPSLTHLLEFGHAKRGGGRVPGRPHIKPVEDEIIKAFTEELKEALGKVTS